MKLKDRAILFAPMLLILTMTCASTYAFVPSKMFLNDAYLTDNAIYLTDRDNNQWRLSPDCNYDLKPSDNPEVMVHSRTVREGTRVTIRLENSVKNCRVE